MRRVKKITKPEEDIIVMGIPAWKWKKKLRRYAYLNPRIYEFKMTNNLCFETQRHQEMLDLFDNKYCDYTNSQYYIYNKKNNLSHIKIIRKINNFKKLYKSIKNKYEDKHPPIITCDHCRLDGSHRLSILLHLNIKVVDLNVAKYKKIFSKETEKEIRKQVRRYRLKRFRQMGYDDIWIKEHLKK